MKKLANIFLCFLTAVLTLSAKDDPRLKYIQQYSDIAVREMKRTGVPASITLAQGILESNSGQSSLAVKANNHFGVKCHKDWSGKKYFRDAEEKNECFRAYSSAEASFRDHSDFLRYQDRYKFLFSLKKTDYKGWAAGLKKAGYATDPAYPQKLIRIIEDYNLDRFDGKVKVEAPEPLVAETPKVVEKEEAVKYMEEFSFHMTRQIYTQNGVPFVYAIEGETYDSIAAKFNLFRKEILRFNDLDAPAALRNGDVVYLKAKKNQAAEGVDKYVVGEEETMTLRDVAQRYGVKLQALRKLNPFAVGDALDAGDTVLLRPVR